MQIRTIHHQSSDSVSRLYILEQLASFIDNTPQLRHYTMSSLPNCTHNRGYGTTSTQRTTFPLQRLPIVGIILSATPKIKRLEPFIFHFHDQLATVSAVQHTSPPPCCHATSPRTHHHSSSLTPLLPSASSTTSSIMGHTRLLHKRPHGGQFVQ